MAAVTRASEYVLGNTSSEHERLGRQGRLIAKITEHWLDEIGLRHGMRVLEVGSGAGDVALMAARMVGEEGEVACVDTDESALHIAERRARQEGLRNLVFHAGDFHRYEHRHEYDAVIGRCVLLHQKHPLASLSAVVRHVRPGGIVAFQEPWFSRGFSYPEAPLFDEMISWLHRTMRATGFDVDIGLRLSSLFAGAGLPKPRLSFEMLVEGNPDSEIYDYCADTVRSLLPRMEQAGIAHSGMAQVDTLAARLRQEAATLGTVVGIMPMMGASSRKPK